jgi:hypothetical protein
MVDGINHDYLEQILEVALEEFHQRLAKFWTGIACARLEGWDVVLRDAQPSRELALGEVVLVAHGAQTSRSNLDIHVLNIRPGSLFVKC